MKRKSDKNDTLSRAGMEERGEKETNAEEMTKKKEEYGFDFNIAKVDDLRTTVGFRFREKETAGEVS